MTNTIRRRIAAVSATMFSLIGVAPQLAAQNASPAGWGAEGRVGNQSGAYLVRRFSDNWSALIGGDLSYGVQKRTDQPALKSNSYDGSASFILRRAFGARAFRPFIGVGPTFMFQGQETKPVQSPSQGVQILGGKTTVHGFGGRGEFGGIMSVTSNLSFGLLMNANVATTHSTFGNPGQPQTEADYTFANIGGLQFFASVKF